MYYVICGDKTQLSGAVGMRHQGYCANCLFEALMQDWLQHDKGR